jgi:hypothetical protein
MWVSVLEQFYWTVAESEPISMPQSFILQALGHCYISLDVQFDFYENAKSVVEKRKIAAFGALYPILKAALFELCKSFRARTRSKTN